ncbi:AMIN domain-containing protein [Laspinema olomoucense]|nr:MULTISPECIES: AMIN domain-containing protein [unclassified Laspinema]
MKQPHALGCLFGASAIVIMASAPAMAVTQITGVNVNTSGGGVQVILDTQGGDRPQVFTVNRGTDVIADIINTQLSLPGGQSFRQINPAPGIASIVVTPLDANSVRVIVSGSSSAPEVAINQADASGINLGFNTGGGVASLPNVSPSAPPPPPGMTPPPGIPSSPNVLVPNPEITIEGGPPPIARPNQASAPPFQPRAVAPPVGDIAVSNIPPATAAIDLGTGSTEIIPRLVLRDASVRDVLSLLARTAGLNLAYTPGVAPAADGQTPQPGAEVADASPKISLDIENESVQDIFNYIIRLSALEANRVGDTIFVGTRLPDEARNVVVRTLRMNQVPATDAAGFLTAQGAETQISRERLDIITIGEGPAARTIESRTPEILALRATQGNGPLLLSGLSVLTNERINGITLVGPPNKVEIATSFLSQLDLRRRQVAVNVKIVDVDLLATENFSTSFSFGINDSFFVNDGGAAVANFGGINPPSANTITESTLVPPVLANPLGGAGLQFDPNQTTQVPLTGPGAGALFLRPVPGISSNPREVRVSEYTVFEVNPTTGVITPGTADFSLPTLFQYPQKFLALLQAQVVSGNAKILTDPTMVVQEGETARLSLTQEIDQPGVYQQVNEDTGVVELFSQPGRIGDAGLTLSVNVQRIDDNGFVTINIIPSVSAPTGRSNTGGTLLSTRTLQSGTIRIRDGQTLILSGIIQDIDRSFVSKIPILGDLPIIGSLFRSTQRENRRQEVIVLVTPQILDDSENGNFGYGYSPGQEVQQMLNQNQ